MSKKTCVNCRKLFTPDPNNPDQDSCSGKCTRSYVIRESAKKSMARYKSTQNLNVGKSHIMRDLAKKRGVPIIEFKMSEHTTFDEMLQHSKE